MSKNPDLRAALLAALQQVKNPRDARDVARAFQVLIHADEVDLIWRSVWALPLTEDHDAAFALRAILAQNTHRPWEALELAVSFLDLLEYSEFMDIWRDYWGDLFAEELHNYRP